MSDIIDYVPEDVLEEIVSAESELKQKRKRYKPYPSSRDVVEAVIEAVRTFSGHPDEFPDYVLEILEARGFDVRHVTLKRIWRTYEMLVRKGVIGDRLGVLAS
ncbi:hypothetical protein [Hyperthermus butylicus]|uniref:Uncharacterized protein n=1 Tax=Hyperthermus butylicus (strain DSM 5456 / JCM 9403 / PLM1-5) TaxID=415426 RepID=A2BM58_HYPBU|nr:hypothetical protein [Hyperthermus butylicus]ABM81069.1 hypothetical protein Hbut_1237 [Hyperthermus butylicus DSM 5456]